MTFTNSCKKMFHFKYPNFTFRFNNPLANLLTSLFLKNLDSKFTPLNASKISIIIISPREKYKLTKFLLRYYTPSK